MHAALARPQRTAQLSNSLSMCSCTLVGSEVPRMDSSSSSEMKKKRGKAQRLVSRYSDSDFWHVSSCSDRTCGLGVGCWVVQGQTPVKQGQTGPNGCQCTQWALWRTYIFAPSLHPPTSQLTPAWPTPTWPTPISLPPSLPPPHPFPHPYPHPSPHPPTPTHPNPHRAPAAC